MKQIARGFRDAKSPPILQIRPQKRAQNTGQAFSSHESRKAFVQFVTPFRGGRWGGHWWALVGVSWGGGRFSWGFRGGHRDTAGTDQPVLGLKTGYGEVSIEDKVVHGVT